VVSCRPGLQQCFADSLNSSYSSLSCGTVRLCTCCCSSQDLAAQFLKDELQRLANIAAVLEAPREGALTEAQATAANSSNALELPDQQQQSSEGFNVTANGGGVDSQVCIITMALATVMLCMVIAVLSSFMTRYMCVCSVIDQIDAAQLCVLPVTICMQCAPAFNQLLRVSLQLPLNEAYKCLC
jgi:hypothetical protein